jgi:endoglucanase
MSRTPSKDLLRRLTMAAGPPGDEGEVRAIVRETLRPVGPLVFDRLGSLLCEKEGTSRSPRVILDAHLDEVAFLVRSLDEDGRLRFLPLGGWWGHVLLAQRVEVVTARGRVPGVIGAVPPHFLGKSERDKVQDPESMYIDLGATSRAEAEELGVRVGDSVVPRGEFLEFAPPGILSAKALDDRLGVGLLCETLLALREEPHPNTVVGVAAVQEEVGSRGAGTACELSRPDVALVLEGTPADDLPGFNERQGALGHGPQVRLHDPTAISNRRLVRFVEQLAAEKDIPIQLAVRRSGGTDAQAIHVHGRGVPTVVIGVPARYIHTPVSLFRWEDYVASLELLVALAQALDRPTVERFTRFAEDDRA